ncbi:hypothetical protein PZB74_19255 [Porifericola rhodea]|uniref:c-type cytochrome domain-containing protein n=1 Tax=Porifericola rhodea TaxID=930972 RepID=UPI002665F5A3|nr:c-type cytochrome domain-containing protein [Porifericola rhodea]WKN31091.1 hypothetical protein PZB74_19255 [Porifericola rhodea]
MRDKLANSLNSTFFLKFISGGAIVFSIILVTLPFWPAPDEAEVSSWLLFSGRLHPLVIHFPIVLLFILLLWEVLIVFKWFERQALFQFIIHIISILSSIAAVLIGFALYQSGGYSGSLMQNHLYMGLGVALGAIWAFVLFVNLVQQRADTSSKLYLGSLFITNLLVVFASHLGGSLTHGEDFLSEHFPIKTSSTDTLSQKPIEEMLVFEDVIQSALQSRCYSCHNENKTKGDYLMTRFSNLLEGGKSGKTAISPGSVEDSELLIRIHLPKNHDDHMPPEGKTSLSPEEITLLEQWISKGAPQGLKLSDIQLDTTFYTLLYRKAQQLQQEMLIRQQKNMELDGLIRLVAYEEQQFVLEKDRNSNGLVLSMHFPPESFDDNTLADLQMIFPHLHKVSLAASSVSDDALYHLGQMDKLSELHLQNTQIRGSGLTQLQKLENLELLDLSGSQIDDAGLLHVVKIKNLKHLYLYETAVSPAVCDALAKNNPELEVHLERGTFF